MAYTSRLRWSRVTQFNFPRPYVSSYMLYIHSLHDCIRCAAAVVDVRWLTGTAATGSARACQKLTDFFSDDISVISCCC
jgi:hypothetical protein